MTLLQIDHVQLGMPPGEEDRARKFFGELLGLTETAKPPELAKRGGVWFERGDLKIHLGVEPGFRASAKAHVALLVSGLTELAARCRAADVRVVEDGELPGYARVYVYDPFGNRIELMEPNTSPVH
jgi:catechol 2,3-dioxygenase-like lactoylglutathione lyase family enzyme